METVLNELSLPGLADTKTEARDRMKELILFLKTLNEINFTKLRLLGSNFFEEELASGYTFNDWIRDNEVHKLYRTLFLGLYAYPFFKELDEKAEDNYILSQFTLNENAHPKNNEKIYGLADAYLRNTLAVSFPTHELWSKCKISIAIKRQTVEGEMILSKEQVIHASNNRCIESDDFKNWYKKRNRPPLTNRADVDIWFPEDQDYKISNEAKDDLIYWYQQNHKDKLKKIEDFFDEIKVNPFSGSGQVEPLKGNLSGWWSRRISHADRLVYKFEATEIIVRQCRGHYDDR